MTAPYTPSLEEARGWYAGARYVFGDPDRQHPDMEDEFDRLIAQVRAETLREAARFLRSSDNPHRGSHPTTEADVMDDAGYLLFIRADRIEREGS